jgi:endoglucanase
MRLRRPLSPVLITLALAALAAPDALAGTANAGLPHASRTNPLAGMPWGVYRGSTDGVYSAYTAASGATRGLLAKLVLHPIVHWFGVNNDGGSAQKYIDAVRGGDDDVGTQFAVFRFSPWESCGLTAGPGIQASYRGWVDGFAAGIGRARALVVLQPDMPFTLCTANPGGWEAMAAYAAKRFDALAHTTVYIDAGAYQWYSPGAIAGMLVASGIRHVRGFAVNSTAYVSTAQSLVWGQRIESALAKLGVRGKHFVVGTSASGSGFLNGQYPGPDVNNARVCSSAHDHLCVSLGIPPTTDVTNRKWRLGPASRAIAARYADAYLWVARPWLVDQGGPFSISRALGIVRSSPFRGSL